MMTPQLPLVKQPAITPIFKPERKILIMPDNDDEKDLDQEDNGNSNEATEAEETLEPRPAQRSGKSGG
jgi:hypothetical protein